MKRYGDELTRHEQSRPTSRRGRLWKPNALKGTYPELSAQPGEKLPFGLNKEHDMTAEEILDHKARIKESRKERNKRKKEAQNEARTIENNERFVKAILDKGGKHENISSDVREHKPG